MKSERVSKCTAWGGERPVPHGEHWTHSPGWESGSRARDPHEWGCGDPHVGRKSTAKANAKLGPYLAVPAARLRELQALGQAGGICGI